MPREFGLTADDRSVMEAEGLSPEQISMAFQLERAVYNQIREIATRLGAEFTVEDIWPTVLNRMKKAHITLVHDYDEHRLDEHGRPMSDVWYVKKDDVLKAMVRPFITESGRIHVHTREYV